MAKRRKSKGNDHQICMNVKKTHVGIMQPWMGKSWKPTPPPPPKKKERREKKKADIRQFQSRGTIATHFPLNLIWSKWGYVNEVRHSRPTGPTQPKWMGARPLFIFYSTYSKVVGLPEMHWASVNLIDKKRKGNWCVPEREKKNATKKGRQ